MMYVLKERAAEARREADRIEQARLLELKAQGLQVN